MKIGLIIPNEEAPHTPKWKRIIQFHPLTMQLLAALTPIEADITIVDESCQKIDLGKGYDIVALSLNTTTAVRGYELAAHYRKQGSYVVLGGVHVSVLPDEALQYADSVVIGEAEGTWPRLIMDFLGGRVKKVYKNDGPADLSNLVRPRRDLLERNAFIDALPVQASRGCVNTCEFCFHQPYRSRPLEDVIREIAELDSKYFSFLDLNTGLPRDYYAELFRRIAPFGKKWFAEVQESTLLDEKFLDLARASGCVAVFVGYESFNQTSVREAGKLHNNPKRYKKGIELAHRCGILVKGSFIFGFDHDTKDAFPQTVESAIDTGMELALFNVLVPYPGTKLFDRLKEEGRLLYTDFPSDWRQYQRTKAVFQPKNMTPQELEEGVRYCWQRFYSARSVTRRLFPPLLMMEERALWGVAQNIPAYFAIKRSK